MGYVSALEVLQWCTVWISTYLRNMWFHVIGSLWKVKVWLLAIGRLTWVDSQTAGQCWKWQLIGVSYQFHSALCGYPLSAIAD